MLLRKEPSAIEVYNDLDGEIVNLFRVLRDRELAERLMHQLELSPFSRAEYDLAHEPAALDDGGVEQARRTLVKSFMGFAGNAATAQYKSGFARRYKDNNGVVDNWVEYPEHVAAFTRRLRGVTIECQPAVEILERYDTAGTLFYVDPPYVRATRNTKGKAYRFEMSDEEHAELARVLWSLQGMVVLSGYSCSLYERLYADWRQVRLDTRADGAAARVECLWISPAAAGALSQSSLLEYGGLGLPEVAHA